MNALLPPSLPTTSMLLSSDTSQTHIPSPTTVTLLFSPEHWNLLCPIGVGCRRHQPDECPHRLTRRLVKEFTKACVAGNGVQLRSGAYCSFVAVGLEGAAGKGLLG